MGNTFLGIIALTECLKRVSKTTLIQATNLILGYINCQEMFRK